MVAWSAEQREALPGIEAAARENGYEEARPVDLEELYAREPNLGPGARGARSRSRARGSSARSPPRSPSRPRRSPRGCELVLNAAVAGVRSSGGGHEIETARGPVRAAHLVNAAGLRSDEVDAMLGHSDFRVTPTARGADRLRQARARPGQPRPAAGPDGEDQGRAGLADRLRQRAARPDGRRRRGQDGPLDHRGGPGVADGGRRADPAASSAGTR